MPVQVEGCGDAGVPEDLLRGILGGYPAWIVSAAAVCCMPGRVRGLACSRDCLVSAVAG